MRIQIVLLIIFLPLGLIAQEANHIQLWASGGITPLHKGVGFYGKTQLNFEKNLGVNVQFGHGWSSPNKYYKKVYYMNTQSSFISGGIVYKTPDYIKKRKRKLNILMTFSFLLGQGKETARSYFKGNDFGDYLPNETYTQKFNFNYFQVSLGATYRLKEKLNLEAEVYATNRPDKKMLGNQYFTTYGNYGYSLFGSAGMRLGIAYSLWKPKPKSKS